MAPDMAALFETPREATAAEIENISQRFGRSAAICKKAGFSGVQIHGAHGYLINQFLSPHHNQRNDEWGGTPEKRRRFMLAVYAEVRKQVGPKFPIGIKLNSADFQRGGFTEEESLAAIRAIVDAGIDLVEISGGTYETGVAQPQKASSLARETSSSASPKLLSKLSFSQSLVQKSPARSTFADRARLLFGVGQLETMTANLRGKLAWFCWPNRDISAQLHLKHRAILVATSPAEDQVFVAFAGQGIS